MSEIFLLTPACLSVIAALSSGTDAIVSRFEAFPAALKAIFDEDEPSTHIKPHAQEQ